jgi:hypothetical protein
MSPDQKHRCTVQLQADGAPYLAFEPATGAISSYSASLVTLDLKSGTRLDEAQLLCARINTLLHGVSATVF